LSKQNAQSFCEAVKALIVANAFFETDLEKLRAAVSMGYARGKLFDDKGDLAGKYSIRINDQWRVVFRWTDAGPEDVEIIDYH
jgi:plasmid maintenance system killer protein